MKGGDKLKIRKAITLKNKQKFGDIYYADLRREGNVQGGCRPVIIVQSDILNASSHLVTVVPTTSHLKRLEFPTHVVIQPSDVNGLTKPSMAMIEQLQTITASRLRAKIGTISHEAMVSLGNAIRQHIPLPLE